MHDPHVSVIVAAALNKLHGWAPRSLNCTEAIPAVRADRVFTVRNIAFLLLATKKWRSGWSGSRGKLQEIAASWSNKTFIHGDFKTTNLLLRGKSGDELDTPLAVVDWEMAGLGDPLWDVGSYVGIVLDSWLTRLGNVRSNMNRASGDLEPIQRQIGYFLIAYHGLRWRSAGSMASLAKGVLEYAGVYFLHRLLEGTFGQRPNRDFGLASYGNG